MRGSGAVAADETGWRIDGDRHWLWAYVGDQVTVYDIAAGRGYRDATAILGEDFAGVLERDGGRRTAGSNTRRIKRVWRTCCAAARS